VLIGVCCFVSATIAEVERKLQSAELDRKQVRALDLNTPSTFLEMVPKCSQNVPRMVPEYSPKVPLPECSLNVP
jgi:hypothetical protein